MSSGNQAINKDLLKQMVQENKDLFKYHCTLMDLNVKVVNAGKNRVLQWTYEGKVMNITAKDILETKFIWKEYIKIFPIKVKEIKRKR